MDRQEQIQNLAKIARISISYAEDLYDSFFPRPEVPPHIADWLKDNDWREDTSGTQTIFDVFDNLTLDASNGCYEDVKEWVKSNGNILAQAWVNGYTVEKEPKYMVKIKGHLGQYLGKYYLNNEELTPQFIRVLKGEGSVFTRTELESSGFGWVFDCPGVEVKEVE